jgi:hypothetical protein
MCFLTSAQADPIEAGPRQIGSRLNEKHQAVRIDRIDPAYPPHERAALRLDVRSVNLGRPQLFF